jgi:hypothetical protein
MEEKELTLQEAALWAILEYRDRYPDANSRSIDALEAALKEDIIGKALLDIRSEVKHVLDHGKVGKQSRIRLATALGRSYKIALKLKGVG